MTDETSFHCPTCGGAEHRVQGPYSVTMVHWVLNPGLAINELLLGQRIPREMLFCESCDAGLPDRTYVRCPGCGALLPGRVWSMGNAFGHWFGLFCPRCGVPIPALRNLAARVLEVLSAPLWFLPWLALRERWVEVEVARGRAMLDAGPRPERSWIRIGLLWFGGAMYVMIGVAPVLIGLTVTALAAAVGWLDWSAAVAGAAMAVGWVALMLPLCAAAGLLWGVIMKLWMERRPKDPGIGSG